MNFFFLLEILLLTSTFILQFELKEVILLHSSFVSPALARSQDAWSYINTKKAINVLKFISLHSLTFKIIIRQGRKFNNGCIDNVFLVLTNVTIKFLLCFD